MNSRQRYILDLNIFIRPLVEQLDGANLRLYVLGKDLVPARVFDLDLAVVGHVGRARQLTKGKESGASTFRGRGQAGLVW